MKNISLIAIAMATLGLTGCASITSDSHQQLALNTHNGNGETVKDAECVLKNDKGEWKAESPGNIEVHRSSKDLHITCTKVGHEEGMVRAISRAAAGMYGNIIFGGGIGAIIDHNSGKGYNYPTALRVVMGVATIIDRKDEDNTPDNETEEKQEAEPTPEQTAAAKIEPVESKQ